MPRGLEVYTGTGALVPYCPVGLVCNPRRSSEHHKPGSLASAKSSKRLPPKRVHDAMRQVQEHESIPSLVPSGTLTRTDIGPGALENQVHEAVLTMKLQYTIEEMHRVVGALVTVDPKRAGKNHNGKTNIEPPILTMGEFVHMRRARKGTHKLQQI